ncbi:MAG: NAD(P)H-dependent oxidoreductase subunit E [Bacillota bacterium]
MDEELAICKKALPFYTTRHHLIPVLQELQSKIGYLPEKVIVEVSRHLRVPASDVYAVTSFYDQFRLQPLGRKRIAVCRGTACHVRGAPQVLREIETITNLKEGETSPDLEYTLETVGCIGCCALAPCVRINKEVFGEMSRERVAELFDMFGEEDGNA